MYFQRTIGNQAVQNLFKSGIIQAKLKIGQPNDTYEQEADRMADQVLRVLKNTVDSGQRSLAMKERPAIFAPEAVAPEKEVILTKRISDQSPIATPEVESRITALRGGGQPLPESVRG